FYKEMKRWSGVLRWGVDVLQYGVHFCGVERIPHYMERIFAASSGFHTIWSEFLRRRAHSTQYGANFDCVERIPHNMELIFAASSGFHTIWSEFLRRRADSTQYGANFYCSERLRLQTPIIPPHALSKKLHHTS